MARPPAKVMQLGHDVLVTNGYRYYTVWTDEYESEFIGEDGEMHPDLDGYGEPVMDTTYRSRGFGDVRDKATAIRKFREWHEAHE